MSKEECYTCSDRLNYVKLCEKYDQLESVHKVLVEDNLTYEKQLADIEAKLAESEEKIKKAHRRGLSQRDIDNEIKLNALREDVANKEKRIVELKQQLAEKEEENEIMAKTLKLTKFVEKEVTQDKISFCIEQLKKVKELLFGSAIEITGTSVDSVRLYSISKIFDNQINQLKEMK